MLETLKTVWNFGLFTTGGAPITVGDLVLVVALVVVGYLASKLVERAIERRLAAASVRANAAYIIQRVAFYSLLAAIVLMALSLLSIPLTAFAFVSGAVAIGVGFGAQNVINNFLSGWILLAEQPVRIGDFIEVDDHKGVIEHIGNRSTRIRRVDGVHLLIPNSQMLERVVVNWTLLDRDIRTTVRVGIAYGSPIARAAKLIEQAVLEQPDIKDPEKALVVLEDFGDNAIVFDAYFWCEATSERELRLMRSAIRFRIAELFDEAGIVIAFPQRDVHVDSVRPLQVQVLQGGDREQAI